ncbi:MAG TPA: NAD(P)/FAD-dependent oxidoreductase [Steroidobacteraceae bacterium]
MSKSGPGTAGARYDCIVVGGGHNGLVCATYLARGGRSVLVLEAANQLGGGAVTCEFSPGFRVSACAHLLYSLSSRVTQDLDLPAHGFTLAAQELPTVALSLDRTPLLIGAQALQAQGTSAVSSADAQAYRSYTARLCQLAAALGPSLESVPPRLASGAWADRLSLLRLGWRVRCLGRRDMRELLRVGGMCIYDLLDEHFSDELLKGALAFDAVLGTNLGPRSPGSVFTLLYRLASAANAGAHAAAAGSYSQPRGGLGALSEALAKAARAAGVQIRTQAAVQRILVRDDCAAGVVLESGEAIEADVVVSNADPKATFLRLLGAQHLDTGFVRRVAHLRTQGLAAKLHLALDALPAFAGVAPEKLAGRLLIAPSLNYLERAYNHSKYGEYSSAPALEITIPTLHDPQLAPPGKHVLSAIVQYAPYALAGGWDEQRPQFTALLMDLLERYAPGIGGQASSVQLLTPRDIEREFRVTGGHWHHAELALDQFFMVRPVPGAAQYHSPVKGLYLCGAGCHPGGGVMGTAGRNAARQVLTHAA